MAGGGCGVTHMSRLSQQSNSSPNTGKPLNLSSPSSAAVKDNKKARKRETLSSRYTAGVPPKRRKLGNGSSKEGPDLDDTKAEDLNPKENSKARSSTSKTAKATSLNPKTGGVLNSKAGGTKKKDLNIQSQDLNRGFRGKSSSKRPPTSEPSGIEIRTEADHEAAHPSNAQFSASPSALPASHVRGSLTSRSTPKQGSLSPEGRVLRPRRQPKREPEDRLPPADYVGKRVVVYWPHAKAWFAGKVLKYDDCSKKHEIKYDDSDEECISFRRHKVMLEVLPPLQSAGGGPYTSEGVVSLAGEGASSAQAVAFPANKQGATALGSCKIVQQQENKVEDTSVIEDNMLLSAVVPRHRFKEGSLKLLCNGSGKGKSAVSSKIADESADVPAQETYKNAGSAVPKDNFGVAGGVDTSDVNGTDRGKAASVYMKRPKCRQKVKVSFTNVAIGGNFTREDNPGLVRTASAGIDDGDGLSGAQHQQELSRRRKKSWPLLQQADQLDFLDARISRNVGSAVEPDTNVASGARGGSQERASRKRNRRSLKKLVSQAFVIQKAKVAEGLGLVEEPGCALDDQEGKRTMKRADRKHKLYSLDRTSDGRVQNESEFVLRSRRAGFRSPLCSVNSATSALSVETEGFICHYGLELHEQQFEVLAEKLEVHDNLLAHKSRTTFHSTIHLLLPVVVPDLFTWQLFNILAGVGFCEGGSFEGRFFMNGSIQDLMSIFWLLLAIIKVMPLSAWINPRCHRQWQGRILHELWIVLSGCGPWCTDVPANLPAEAESVLMQHLRGASVSHMMTSRQMLNIVVCYFIKPYIIATVCEKGALLTVVVQQFLLLESSKHGGTRCVRQSVKSVQLQSGAGGADLDFSSYLALFPGPEDWRSERGLFLKQMEKWVATATSAGHAEQLVPVPSIRFLNHLGWRVTTARVANREYNPDESGSKVSYVEQTRENSDEVSVVDCSRLATEFGDGVLDQGFGSPNGFYKCTDLNSTLILVSMLQKNLHLAGRKNLPSVGVDLSLVKSTLLLDKVFLKDRQSSKVHREKMSGKEVEAGPGSVVVPTMKRVKVEPDINMSRQSLPIMTESNSADAVKEESSVDTYGWQQTQNDVVREPDLKGQLDIGGLALKTMEDQFSGQIDKEYYMHARHKDVKKGKGGCPRRNEQGRCTRVQMAPYCSADLLLTRGDTVWREPGARVELQLNASSECLVSVHLDGKTYMQKVVQGSTLSKNPPQLTWKSRDGWALEFSDKEQWELFRCMHNAFGLGNARGASVKEIPIPGVSLIEDCDDVKSLGASFRPHSAIKHHDNEIEAALKNNRVLYDLDSEDEAWVVEANRKSSSNEDDGSSAKALITEDDLERMIDKLEKEAYRRREESVSVNDAVQLCQVLGSADVVQAVHAYWSKKRLIKGKALLRHFQPLHWEQYQKELQNWEAKMEQCPPSAQKLLLDQFPRPLMSAFCLQSRSLDTMNRSKKMQRQKSQKKLKPSRSSSEDSHRVSAYRFKDPGWHPSYRSRQAVPSAYMAVGSQKRSMRDQFHGEVVSERVEEAREKAVAARRVAAIKAAKCQRRFLDFDSALQRAWVLLIEYEAVTGGKPSARSDSLEARMELLFSRCSSFLGKDNDSSEDEPPSDSGPVASEVGPEFLEAFTNKCSIDGKVVCKVDEQVEELKEVFTRLEEASPEGRSGRMDWIYAATES